MKSFLSLFKKKSSSSDASSSDKDAPYSPSIGFVPATPPFAYRKHKTHVVKKPRPYRLNGYAKALITSGGNPAAMAKALVGQGDPPKDLPDFKVLFPANSAVIDLCNNNNTTTPGCMASFDVIQKDKWVPQKYMVTCGKVPERVKKYIKTNIIIQ